MRTLFSPVDPDALRAWIGRTQSAEDILTPQLVRAFEATFDGDPRPVISMRRCQAAAFETHRQSKLARQRGLKFDRNRLDCNRAIWV